MHSWDDLPLEVWEEVFKNCGVQSLGRLSSVCRRFQAGLERPGLWRRRFLSSYTAAYKRLLRRNSDAKLGSNWRHLYRFRKIDAPARLSSLLFSLSSEYFYHDGRPVPPFVLKEALVEELGDPEKLVLLTDTARATTAKDWPEPPREELTMLYYGKQVLAFLNQECIKAEFRQWEAWDTDQLQSGAMLVSKWFQPHANLDPTPNDLLHMAMRMAMLSQEDQKLPHLSKEARDQRLLEILGRYFTQWGYIGDNHDYYAPENSFYEQVLLGRRGIPITLSILYSDLARSRGIELEFVNVPTHLFLRRRVGDTPVFIDAYEGGKERSRAEVEAMIGQPIDPHMPAMTKLEVMQRMGNNLGLVIQNEGWDPDRHFLSTKTARLASARLSFFLARDDGRPALVRYIHQLANLGLFEEILKMPRVDEIAEDAMAELTIFSQLTKTEIDREKQAPAKKRSELGNSGVKFRVGMVMRHLRYGYRCVIRGWDPVCRQSEAWQAQMGVHNLPNGAHQPYYHVLVDDDSERYAAQGTATGA